MIEVSIEGDMTTLLNEDDASPDTRSVEGSQEGGNYGGTFCLYSHTWLSSHSENLQYAGLLVLLPFSNLNWHHWWATQVSRGRREQDSVCGLPLHR